MKIILLLLLLLFIVIFIFIFILYFRRSSITPEPIDLVIPWSGENYPGDKEYSSRANRDEGILKYSIRSIIKYTPWIRTIYIFKDPPNNYPSWLDENRVSHKIKIIDRCKYFKNKEWCPSMNIAAIDCNTYKINGLSDNYLRIEDDTLLTNYVNYTDFFTDDMNKIKSSCTFPIKEIYNSAKINKTNIKPPIHPKQFSNGDDHIMISLKKELYYELNNKYPDWFDFVSSHKKRWCADNECPNPEDDCKACYDELGICMRVPHYEAYLQGKYEYREDLPYIGPSLNYNFIEHLEKIKNKEIQPYFLCINNIESDDYQRENPEEFEKKKNKIHEKLEEMFPEDEFYDNISKN
jgi:hypothetical protein